MIITKNQRGFQINSQDL